MAMTRYFQINTRYVRFAIGFLKYLYQVGLFSIPCP